MEENLRLKINNGAKEFVEALKEKIAERVQLGENELVEKHIPKETTGNPINTNLFISDEAFIYADAYNKMVDLRNDLDNTSKEKVSHLTIGDFNDIKSLKDKYKRLINGVSMEYPNEKLDNQSQEFKEAFNNVREHAKDIVRLNGDGNKNVHLIIKDFIDNLVTFPLDDKTAEDKLKQFMELLITQERIITYMINVANTKDNPDAKNELLIKTKYYQNIDDYNKFYFRWHSQIEYANKIEDLVYKKWMDNKDEILSKVNFKKFNNRFYKQIPQQKEDKKHDYVSEVVEMIQMDSVPFEKAISVIEGCDKVDLIKYIVKIKNEKQTLEKHINDFKEKYTVLAGNTTDILNELETVV